MAKFFITTPIYYANAKPHVGSAYTTIAADVLARWHRAQGHDTHFLCGLAEHGTKISQSADVAGKTPQEFVDENAVHFKNAWQALDISYDDFIRTTEPRHEKAVIAFFEKLKASGKIYEGEYEGLYCVGHEAFIKESDLDEKGLCPDHQTKPEAVKEQNWFFKLSDYADVLKEKINSGEFVIEPETRRNEVLAFIEQGLEDIAISRRNVPWAIPLPWDKDQTIYVWLDELFNYCSAVGYGQDEDAFRRWWPADIHVVGKDIIKFHCIIWPALLMAIEEPIPQRVFANGFLTVNGQKISKSLGNAIDPVAVAKEFSADTLRYYLLRELPFGNDGDFSADRLKERYNSDLANGLGNFVSRLLNMIEKFHPNFDPDLKSLKANKEHQQLLNGVGQHIQNLAFDQALTTIWHAITESDRKIEHTKPWELAKAGKQEEVQAILEELFVKLVGVCECLVPLLPQTAEVLGALLSARPLKKPATPLFARRAD